MARPWSSSRASLNLLRGGTQNSEECSTTAQRCSILGHSSVDSDELYPSYIPRLNNLILEASNNFGLRGRHSPFLIRGHRHRGLEESLPCPNPLLNSVGAASSKLSVFVTSKNHSFTTKVLKVMGTAMAFEIRPFSLLASLFWANVRICSPKRISNRRLNSAKGNISKRISSEIRRRGRSTEFQ